MTVYLIYMVCLNGLSDSIATHRITNVMILTVLLQLMVSVYESVVRI